jgi:hypothetical protein
MLLLAAVASWAQGPQPPVNSPLLDHLAGRWIANGSVAKQAVAHEVQAEWVLQHHYLRLHEVAEAKNAGGEPQYEAEVYVAWNEEPKNYSCAFLDVYGGLNVGSIGVAQPRENQLPFVFKNVKGETDFINEWTYDPKTDTWAWRLANVENGTEKPFAQFKLTRK